MKKILLIIFVVIFGFLTVKQVFAADNVFRVGLLNSASKTGELTQVGTRLASKAAAITQRQENVSQDLKQRAQTEINRRINFLNQLLTRLSDIKKLSSAEKADLQSQIQTQVDGLNTLLVKINADTDNTTLEADVKSIVNNYYIFLFFRVKVNLLIAADRLSTITDNLDTIYAKLQTRIDQAQTQGTDVTSLNSLLSDMNSKISDAKTLYSAAETELTSLTAQGYPGNKSTLSDARTKLQTVRDDSYTAYQDAIKIRQSLGGMGLKNPEATASGVKNSVEH